MVITPVANRMPNKRRTPGSAERRPHTQHMQFQALQIRPYLFKKNNNINIVIDPVIKKT